MAPQSAFLQALPSLAQLAPDAALVAVAAAQDYVVYPLRSALPDGARHVVLRDLGHVGLVASKQAKQVVTEALAVPSSG